MAAGKKKKNSRGISKLLRQVQLFHELSDRELRKLTAIAEREQHPREHYLFRRDDRGDALYIISSGLVKIMQYSPRRRAKTLAILGPGEVFGEMALLNEGVRSAGAVVLEDTEVLVVRKSVFLKLLRENFSITSKILKTLCERLTAADREIEDLTFKNIEGRIASKLLQLAENFGLPNDEGTLIDLELTHQELADLVGTNRETVSHKLAAFKREGSIDVTRDKRFILLNDKALRSWMR